MKLLLIGGHTRNTGKTALAVDIIRAFRQAQWTAVKITQYGHGICSINGEACGCAPEEHAFSITEEASRENRSDTSRFLIAGAARSLWMRTKQGQLAGAMAALRQALGGAKHVIIESNSLMALMRPALYLVVLDPTQSDFKASARLYLDRADAVVLRAPVQEAAWQGVSAAQFAAVPHFAQKLGQPLPVELADFVRVRYFQQYPEFEAVGNHLSS